MAFDLVERDKDSESTVSAASNLNGLSGELGRLSLLGWLATLLDQFDLALTARNHLSEDLAEVLGQQLEVVLDRVSFLLLHDVEQVSKLPFDLLVTLELLVKAVALLLVPLEHLDAVPVLSWESLELCVLLSDQSPNLSHINLLVYHLVESLLVEYLVHSLESLDIGLEGVIYLLKFVDLVAKHLNVLSLLLHFSHQVSLLSWFLLVELRSSWLDNLVVILLLHLELEG